MQWNEIVPADSRITEVRQRLQDHECILTWKWPENVQFVYIYGFAADAELSPKHMPDKAMRLFTREEYKAKAGYRVRIETIGVYAFRIYPCERTAEGLVVLRQTDSDNQIRFSTGKAVIRYSIKYGRALFSRTKPVRIELTSEVLVPMQALCYVKKEGSFPLHKDDGLMYPFIRDLQPGRNVLPEIEISKNDQIKLFFTDGPKYGEIYELIPE